ncbi:MAG: hypothetical protein EI684_17475 [Candidatus Viridilinea halotolerans]|uniref:PglZ domain-containing protein n=1 Tax=Candidatus Viridilinea halotolerans TaxID=2491704 RepID=A0A426TU56_9CHLR|nr:MAG: hypothetical protein EI684_17475 [Candidatus Viridilinea halotolerans]
MRQAIRRALDDGKSLTLHVTSRLLLHWLEDFIGYSGVEWVPVAPERDYRRIFGSDPPALFTPEVLLAANIATINVPPPGVAVDAAGWVLGERLHPLWSAPQASSNHLSELSTWVVSPGASIAPALYPLVQDCLTKWAAAMPAYGALHAGSLGADVTNLIRSAALRHYPAAWRQAHGLHHLPVASFALHRELWVQALRELGPPIEHYWREQVAEREPDQAWLQAALAAMSGWSHAELRMIEAVILRDPALLNAALVQTLRQKFGALHGAAVTLDELEQLVPPPQPAQPQADWSDQQWLTWATQAYMPYFAWTVRTQQPCAAQAAYALCYADWLAQRYPHWLTAVGSPLITSQFTLMRDLLVAQPDAVVVWLVADGLTWWQGKILRESCQQHGLHPQRYEPAVALLPSITSISKRALVTGILAPEEVHGTLAQAAQEKLTRVGVRGFVSYHEQEVLAAVRSSAPPQCVIWLANELDRQAHEQITFTDDMVVRAIIERFGQTLAKLRDRCIERGHPFHALIGSDHGSTLLPATAPTRRMPTATREVIDVWEDSPEPRSSNHTSARAAQVSADQHLQIEEDAWYHLDRLRYQLAHAYLIPRGYAAVGRRPTGWTHGGLTPEETIVPLMHLTPEPLVMHNLRLALSGRLQPQREGMLVLLLTNPNPAPLDHLVVRIADLQPVAIERIEANGRHETTLTYPARPLDGAELALPWTLDGQVLGVTHHQQGAARIAVRRLQSDTSMDDMFG